jgi:hypothetical protein
MGAGDLMGVKQFLLNPDGSVPDGTDISALKRAGIPLVLPTPRWRAAAGMMLVEADPEMRDGVLRQTWVEVPVPPDDPPVD